MFVRAHDTLECCWCHHSCYLGGVSAICIELLRKINHAHTHTNTDTNDHRCLLCGQQYTDWTASSSVHNHHPPIKIYQQSNYWINICCWLLLSLPPVCVASHHHHSFDPCLLNPYVFYLALYWQNTHFS